ncbi:hypothetical protein L3X38_013340 [Prunus dulcis]|uniref:Uncharacterized protein n=1 Tax=Prunus dulcis TaxID=3755 RepID=A0AAD4WLQ8_PRUDU|nr:hypothetical protein L3X38_013340 [Prunus dulcis]
MPFQDPLCPFVLGGNEKLGHSAGVLHLDDAHPDILVPLKHLLINYFPAHETNRMIHHCIFGFTIPTAMTLVQPRAASPVTVSLSGPLHMLAIGPLRLAQSRFRLGPSRLHPPPGPGCQCFSTSCCSLCWLSPQNWFLLCINSFLGSAANAA